MEAFKVPHMKRQGMSPPRVVQGRVPVQFGPNPATAGSLWRALRLSGKEALQKKRPCPTEAFKVPPVRHWGIQSSAWPRGGLLCSLVPIQPLQDHFGEPSVCLDGRGSAKKETLSHRGFQSATCETLGHPIIRLAKGRAPVQFGPNPAAAGPSVVTP